MVAPGTGDRLALTPGVHCMCNPKAASLAAFVWCRLVRWHGCVARQTR